MQFYCCKFKVFNQLSNSSFDDDGNKFSNTWPLISALYTTDKIIDTGVNLETLALKDLFFADYNHIYSGWITRNNTFYSCPENWWVAG